MRTTVVIPFRGPGGKRRLGHLPRVARERLARAMLADVVAACEPVGEVVVTEAAGGQGRAVAAALPPEGLVLVVNADLPCVRSEDVGALAAAVPPGGIALVEAADGTTNALGLASPGLFRPLYGPGSAARYRALGGVPVALPGLAEDVDTLDDLARLAGRIGPRTRSALAENGLLYRVNMLA